MRARTLLVALAAPLALPAGAQAHVELTPDAGRVPLRRRLR